MTKLILAALLFLHVYSFGQSLPDCGKVWADNQFTDTSSSTYHSNNIDAYNDSLHFGIGNILYSPNDIEIRLKTYVLHSGDEYLVIISNHQGNWDAKKYSVSRNGPYSIVTAISFQKTPGEASIYNYVFDTIFDTLKLNNIFLLPGPNGLKIKGRVDDGIIYHITFKVGNKFRRYGFANPAAYIDDNPEVEELKQFVKIYQNMNSLFR
jgi:hypothetical protein